MDTLHKGDDDYDDNNNNAIITNHCGSLQDLILFFKISMGTRKNFFGIYIKFGHVPAKKFASLAGDFFLTSRQALGPLSEKKRPNPYRRMVTTWNLVTVKIKGLQFSWYRPTLYTLLPR